MFERLNLCTIFSLCEAPKCTNYIPTAPAPQIVPTRAAGELLTIFVRNLKKRPKGLSSTVNSLAAFVIYTSAG